MPLRPNYHAEKEAREKQHSPAMPEKGNEMPGTYVAHNEPNGGDPLDAAMAPPEPPRFWGQVKDIEVYKIGFKKLADGSWERPTAYDPEYHDFASDQIKFVLLPLDATRPVKELEMGLNNRKNPEFRKIVQPSVFALSEKIRQAQGGIVEGANLFRALIGLWVFGEYVKRPWNKDGEDWTTLEFQDVFATEDECKAHQATVRAEEGEESLPFPDAQASPQQAPSPPSPQVDPMRATMATFLPGLWDVSGHDKDKFLKLIADNPMVSQHFGEDSPEVQKYLTATPDGMPF